MHPARYYSMDSLKRYFIWYFDRLASFYNFQWFRKKSKKKLAFEYQNISSKTPIAGISRMWLSVALQVSSSKIEEKIFYSWVFAGPGTWTCLTTFFPRWRLKNALPPLSGPRKAQANRMAERWIFLAFPWIKWEISYFNYSLPEMNW